MWMRIRSALRNLLDRRQIESELDSEIRSYVDAIVDEKVAEGLSPEEARRRALAESGGMEQIKQAVRDVRAGSRMELVFQDLRYATRQLIRNPVYAWTVIITLAACIGANTAVFSCVNALLLRPLPYAKAKGFFMSRNSGRTNLYYTVFQALIMRSGGRRASLSISSKRTLPGSPTI